MKKQIIKGIGYLLAAMVLLSVSASTQAAETKTKVSMKVGESKKLAVKNIHRCKISWKSSQNSVASVSKTGKLKAKNQGKAKITAKGKSKGKKYQYFFRVTVKEKEQQRNDNSAVKASDTDNSAVIPGSVSQESPAPDTVPASQNAITVRKIHVFNCNMPSFEDQVVSDYESLQKILETIKRPEEEWYPGKYEEDVVAQLESYDEEYFVENSLVLCIDAKTWGYKVGLQSIMIKEDETGNRTLNCNIQEIWTVPENCDALCVEEYYTFLVEVPSAEVSSDDQVVINPVVSAFTK